MKQLVNKEQLSGWREPKESEVRSIKEFSTRLIWEKLHILLCIDIPLLICFIIVIFNDFLFSEISIELVVFIAILIVTTIINIQSNSSNLVDIGFIRKAIKNNKYTVEKCYINYIDHKINSSNLIKMSVYLAYIHNELNEYCMSPIEVDGDVIEALKLGYNTEMILMNIENRIYKIVTNLE